MRFAYADPPYVGCSHLYDHPEAAKWDRHPQHIQLMHEMDVEYDAWALSLHTPSLRFILGGAPSDVRVAAWVKPFASFKPGVDPAYAWEPVIFRTARKWSRDQSTCRDYISANITLKKGLTGAKPPAFCQWLFDLLGAQPGDEFVDLFPGTGIVTAEWEARCNQGVLALAPTVGEEDRG